MTDAQFKEASDFLRQVHKNVRLYWTDSSDIDQAFSGNALHITLEVVPQRYGELHGVPAAFINTRWQVKTMQRTLLSLYSKWA